MENKTEEKINEILITLTDKTGFDHSIESIDAFSLAEADLIELFERFYKSEKAKSRQEEKERIKREIEERSKIERKKGWHITDIEQCRQFIDDILNLI